MNKQDVMAIEMAVEASLVGWGVFLSLLIVIVVVVKTLIRLRNRRNGE